jgi:hypothetical protein
MAYWFSQPASENTFSESSRFSRNDTATILQSEQNMSKNSHRRTIAYQYTNIYSDLTL